MRISATVAFVSLIFWAYLLGTLGALLAVPATLFLVILLDNLGPGQLGERGHAPRPARRSHVPSAEQADNRRRGRAEDRIPQIAQDRMGLLTLTVRTKPCTTLACKIGVATISSHTRAAVSTSVGRARRLRPCRSTATTSD